MTPSHSLASSGDRHVRALWSCDERNVEYARRAYWLGAAARAPVRNPQSFRL